MTRVLSAAAAARSRPSRRDFARIEYRAAIWSAVICVADALIAASSALASCHLLDRASLRSASIAFDPAAQHWEAGLIALAPVIVCLSMFHQRAYSFGSFVPPRTEIRSATISWIYAAGLVGLASSGMLNAE